MKKIIIATRGSALALWQAEHVKARLLGLDSSLNVDLLVMKTTGDVILDVPLAKVGGKGLFVKEIEEALLDGRADLAVHSMKDVPMVLPEGLILAAVPEREVFTDLYLSETCPTLADLPQGAVLGTSSLRRQAQALALRPDLQIRMLRGNVETRLRKMREGQYQAIILAAAGMKRLGLVARYQEELAPPRFIPAVGQGALGIEIREDREDVRERIAPLEHHATRVRVEAERAFLAGLDGGCQVPIGAWAHLVDSTLHLEGLVAEPDGRLVIRSTAEAPLASTDPERNAPCFSMHHSDLAGKDTATAQELGRSLALDVLSRGADRILQELYTEGKA